jgi:hypothetical protein
MERRSSMSANVNDRESIARVYPREAYEEDAGRNALAKTPVLHGVRILSQPDEAGSFRLARAHHQVAERDPEGDTVFLAPYLGDELDALQRNPTYGGPEEKDGLSVVDPRGDYEAFLDRIVEAARSARFKGPIGKGEERLRGFHGG